MKVSIVTAVYNRAATLADAFDSVFAQSDADVQSVVVDGMSNDGSAEVVDRYADRIGVHVREPDDGIYDALNKGVRLATGDVVGFLHADDMLADDHCLSAVADAFDDPGVDAVFGDLLYVDQHDTDKVVRYWNDAAFDRSRFRRGWMPAHPTVYVRRHFYENFGAFRDDFRTSADYESLVRLLYKRKLNAKYIPKVLVKMRCGGQSNASIANRRLANQEDQRAWVVNGLKPPPLLRLTKPLRKLPQYWRRPEPNRIEHDAISEGLR